MAAYPQVYMICASIETQINISYFLFINMCTNGKRVYYLIYWNVLVLHLTYFVIAKQKTRFDILGIA